MKRFPEALMHGPLTEIFPDVFIVTGEMKTVLMNSGWQFSRNMVVVRDEGELTLINTVRLTERGLQELEALGRVCNIVRIGSLHGRDDAFYKDRYAADYWALEGMPQDHGPSPDRILRENGEMPFKTCRAFEFRTTKLPECIIHIDRNGGILVACDSLQNWLGPDEFFSEESRAKMEEMGFFQPANFGPVWMQVCQPEKSDFVRLGEFPFKHVLCGHGLPLLNTAKAEYLERSQIMFGIQ